MIFLVCLWWMLRSLDKASSKLAISKLVKMLGDVVTEGSTNRFTEVDVDSKFIQPFLRALGWVCITPSRKS